MAGVLKRMYWVDTSSRTTPPTAPSPEIIVPRWPAKRGTIKTGDGDRRGVAWHQNGQRHKSIALSKWDRLAGYFLYCMKSVKKDNETREGSLWKVERIQNLCSQGVWHIYISSDYWWLLNEAAKWWFFTSIMADLYITDDKIKGWKQLKSEEQCKLKKFYSRGLFSPTA